MTEFFIAVIMLMNYRGFLQLQLRTHGSFKGIFSSLAISDRKARWLADKVQPVHGEGVVSQVFDKCELVGSYVVCEMATCTHIHLDAHFMWLK